jgi:hypothetical protein
MKQGGREPQLRVMENLDDYSGSEGQSYRIHFLGETELGKNDQQW